LYKNYKKNYNKNIVNPENPETIKKLIKDSIMMALKLDNINQEYLVDSRIYIRYGTKKLYNMISISPKLEFKTSQDCFLMIMSKLQELFNEYEYRYDVVLMIIIIMIYDQYRIIFDTYIKLKDSGINHDNYNGYYMYDSDDETDNDRTFLGFEKKPIDAYSTLIFYMDIKGLLIDFLNKNNTICLISRLDITKLVPKNPIYYLDNSPFSIEFDEHYIGTNVLSDLCRQKEGIGYMILLEDDLKNRNIDYRNFIKHLFKFLIINDLIEKICDFILPNIKYARIDFTDIINGLTCMDY
jgi:hypothetical protein